MKNLKKVIVMTKENQIIPLNVKWSNKFSIPVNIKRYVLPIVGCECIVGISRGWSWSGASKWHYQFEKNPLWQSAISATSNDDTLWV